MNRTHDSAAHDVLIDCFDSHCPDQDCSWYGNAADCTMVDGWERHEIDDFRKTGEKVPACPWCGLEVSYHEFNSLDHNDIRLVTTEIANIVGWLDVKADHHITLNLGFRELSVRVIDRDPAIECIEENLVAGSYEPISLRPEEFDPERVRNLIWHLETLS